MRTGFTLALAILATVVLASGETVTPVTVANINVLHGIDCFPVRGDQCRLPDRLQLLFAHLVALGCPDLVTLQEIVTQEFALTGVLTNTAACVGPLDDALGLIEQGLSSLAQACGFPYGVVFDPAARRTPLTFPCLPGRGTDEELILTRYPVGGWELMPLYSPVAPFFFRHVLHARIAHPVGPLDVFTTHLDGPFDTAPCGFQLLPIPGLFPACPAACRGQVCAGRECSVRECQAKQVAAFVEARHHGPEPAILAGDFNAPPDTEPHPLEATYQEFTGRGWLDSDVEAGNPQCDGAPPLGEGIGCTAGRVAVRPDGSSELEEPALNVDERIDYIFVVPPTSKSVCTVQKMETGLFADQPNPFENNCGPSGPICWASDHNGTRAELSCSALGRL